METSLRCNRCNRPICAKCAQRTPVGFRCSECVLAIEDRYYSQVQGDYLNPYDRPPAKPLFTYILMGAIALVSGVWLVVSFWAAGGWGGTPLPGQPGGGTIAYGQKVEGYNSFNQTS